MANVAARPNGDRPGAALRNTYFKDSVLLVQSVTLKAFLMERSSAAKSEQTFAALLLHPASFSNAPKKSADRSEVERPMISAIRIAIKQVRAACPSGWPSVISRAYDSADRADRAERTGHAGSTVR